MKSEPEKVDNRDPHIGFRLPVELLARLDAYAARNRWTISQALRELVEFALDEKRRHAAQR